MPPDPREPDRSRSALLAAALDEFARYGYAGARVQRIAATAGVNKQLISYYFGGKAGLYRHVQQDWLRQDAAATDPEQPLEELAAHYLAEALEDPRPTRLMAWRGLAEAGDQPPDQSGERIDASGIRKRQATGEVDPGLDPEALLLGILGMVTAPVVMPHLAEKILGVPVDSAEFASRYGRHLRAVIQRLAPDNVDGCR